MFKVLCTGNPNDVGIAMEIKKLFPNATFVSRTSGYDLSTEEGLLKFKDQLKTHNVLVNNAHVDFGVQERLLMLAREEWKSGHVFNIGSLAEYTRFMKNYYEVFLEKNRLKELGLNLTDENFKVTHVTVGVFKSSVKPNTMNNTDLTPAEIVSAIKWIMESEFQVPVIGIEKVNDVIRNHFGVR